MTTPHERGRWTYKCDVCGQTYSGNTLYKNIPYNCGIHCGQPWTMVTWCPEPMTPKTAIDILTEAHDDPLTPTEYVEARMVLLKALRENEFLKQQLAAASKRLERIEELLVRY